MATRCPQCGKKPRTVTKRKLLRGHYNPTSKSKKYPNLQWATMDPEKVKALGSKGNRVKICTDCIKTIYKTR